MMLSELSLREREIGGKLRLAVLEHPLRGTAATPRIVLLIHGYNVTLCKAGCDYDTFENNADGTSWITTLARFYWPGDVNVPGGRFLGSGIRRALSGTTYVFQIATARRAAELLSQWFCAGTFATRQPALHIVAHSLGCRLALELLEQFAGNSGAAPPVRNLILMAAAVPRYMVEERGELWRGAKHADHILAFVSTADFVLNWMFRFGEASEYAMAGTDALRWTSRGAIGRHGMPSLPNAQNVFAWKAGHSDFWPSREAARVVDGSIEAILRCGVPRPPVLPGRYIAPRDIVVRQLAGRIPTGRTMGRRRGLCEKCTACV